MPASSSLDVGDNGTGLTIECWISPNILTSEEALLEWNNGETFGTHFHINVSGTGTTSGHGAIYFNLGDYSGINHNYGTVDGILNTNGFQHVAVTYDKASGNSVIYYNGAVMAESGVQVTRRRPAIICFWAPGLPEGSCY